MCRIKSRCRTWRLTLLLHFFSVTGHTNSSHASTAPLQRTINQYTWHEKTKFNAFQKQRTHTQIGIPAAYTIPQRDHSKSFQTRWPGTERVLISFQVIQEERKDSRRFASRALTSHTVQRGAHVGGLSPSSSRGNLLLFLRVSVPFMPFNSAGDLPPGSRSFRGSL